MADILIKSMEMPKDEAVALYIYPDGRAKLWRPQSAVSHEFEAVPVPPHGDLVDRDETIEAGKSHPTYKNSKIVKVVVDKACCLLKTATVVIPANKED